MTPAQEAIVIQQSYFPCTRADVARWHFDASGCIDAPEMIPAGSTVKDEDGVYPADVRRA